jgi:hypothetical protein
VAAQELFDEVAERMLADDPSLEQGRMFNAVGLKTAGRFLAMVVRDELVVKLPADRVTALVGEGAGERFDPGHGRLMREWVALRPADAGACRAYVVEARRFVGGAASPGQDGRRRPPRS